MIQVYIEISNIIWEKDPNKDVAYEQGTSRRFYADIPDLEGAYVSGYRCRNRRLLKTFNLLY